MKMIVVIVMLMLSTPIKPLLAKGVDEVSTSCELSSSDECGASSKTDAQRVLSYCAFLKHAATFDRQYFCLLINTQLLYLCGVQDTVGSLCYGSKIKAIAEKTVTAAALLISFIFGMIFYRQMEPKLNAANYRQRPRSQDISCTEMEANDTYRQALAESNNVNRAEIEANVTSLTLSEPNDVNSAGIEANVQSITLLEANDIDSNDVNREQFVVNYSQDVSDTDEITTHEPLQYGFTDLQAATNDFSEDNKLGRGGLGYVYKGVLPNGEQIAVKRASYTSSGFSEQEFFNEVETLAKLQHRNVVKLLGFCHGDEEQLTVYEFLANKSLDCFLFDSERREELNWSSRFGIIKGVARGMMYLHDDCPVSTLHRDLKPGNILLDAKMHPRITGFELAITLDVGQTTIDVNQVAGTIGYMAPEYVHFGQFSAKSDIYSFGVLLLEIISGRRLHNFNNFSDESLLSYAQRCWDQYQPLEILDPMCRDSFSSEEVVKCIQLGLLCVQEDDNIRPPMSMIVDMLNVSSGASLFTTLRPARAATVIYNDSSDDQHTTIASESNSSS